MDQQIDIHTKIDTQQADTGCRHCDPQPIGDENSAAGLNNIPAWREHLSLLIAFGTLFIMLVLEHGFAMLPPGPYNFIIHAIAYILAGYQVVRLALRRIRRGDFFNEFVLMTVATLGAFYLGAYSEGVAVMVFYCIGEWFQDAAVDKARRNIKALLDLRPATVLLRRNGTTETVHPSTAAVGEIMLVRTGEHVALDGRLMSTESSFNAAALTGESIPVVQKENDSIYAGTINLGSPVEIEITAGFKDSALSRILQMVQDASARKSQTQLFISRFARVYTPIVFFMALALCLVPYFVVDDYIFHDWLYRSLVFLVISCPCALVVSIPLGYFGGIGLASRNGILFKGGNFLDAITKIDTVVMDKTGTLTEGVFKVQEINAWQLSREELLQLTAALEIHSTHPVAKAIVAASPPQDNSYKASGVKEFAGMGITGRVDDRTVVAGNSRLFDKLEIAYPAQLHQEEETIVLVATDGRFAGYFLIADQVKEDVVNAITGMHTLKLDTIILSGDRMAVTKKIAQKLGVDKAFGDLMPADKLNKVEELIASGRRVAFAGDGINDAPVIARADVGIAMGGLGSHAAIETADIVIQNDQPSKILTAIRIGKITRNVVWQNIIMAMAVKIAVLVLGAEGIASLWEAVIADVGVALLAILNSVRIQRFRF